MLSPPDEEWVIVSYRTRRVARLRELKVQWLVSANDEIDNARPRGLILTAHIRRLRKLLFAQMRQDEPVVAQVVPTRHGNFGYLRIFTFDVDDVDGFVKDVVDRVRPLPRNGLIIDVRANEGGRTAAAERLLQLFSPDYPRARIEPERLCFINTLRTLQLCRLQQANTTLGPDGLHPWIESIERAMQTGAPYSANFPITDPDLCNDSNLVTAGERLYPGPVIVITDGLSRSAAEVFAAGFQDHGGTVLGIDQITGGAGANVRRHSELSKLFKKAKRKSPFKPLPNGADFLIPIRRFQRVRRNAGIEIEDFEVSRKVHVPPELARTF